MEYFIISQDDRITAAEPYGITREIKKDLLKKENISQLDDRPISFNIKEKSRNEYIDFIERPFPLVSEKLKYILQKYNESIFFRPVVLADAKHTRQELYWLMIPGSKDCLSNMTQLNKDGSIKRLVINAKKAADHKIFKINGIAEDLIIISLDVAESLLRRDFTGIRLQKVEKES